MKIYIEGLFDFHIDNKYYGYLNNDVFYDTVFHVIRIDIKLEFMIKKLFNGSILKLK